jgi:hypothetical protein
MRLGLPDREGFDVLFSQLIVDYWSSFAWNGNPNPKREVLDARGYWETGRGGEDGGVGGGCAVGRV